MKTPDKTTEYAQMIGLLETFSAATAQRDELEAQLNGQFLELVHHYKATYATLQEAAGVAEAALEILARSHPEWFEEKKTIKTPFGSVKFHASTVLEIANEEATVILIEGWERDHLDFDAALYLRETVTVNREGLEELDDATLKAFRVKRVPKENFSVVPAKVDLGKAVKQVTEAA